MALIVEDGTGRADAESLISVADADAYLAKFSVPSVWSALTSDQKEIALRKGARYLLVNYVYRGSKFASSQALPFPRLGCYDNDGNEVTGVPTRAKNAQVEAAVRSVSEELLPDLSTSAGVLESAVEVGDIKLQEKYSGANPPTKTFTVVDGLLKEYTQSKNEVAVERA